MMLMYALGIGLLSASAWWLELLAKNVRPLAFMGATVTVFIVWRFLGAVRLELRAEELRVSRFGLLGRPSRIPYARIVRVEVADEEANVGMVLRLRVVEEGRIVTELGPWSRLDRYLALQDVEEARRRIEDQAERARRSMNAIGVGNDRSAP